MACGGCAQRAAAARQAKAALKNGQVLKSARAVNVMGKHMVRQGGRAVRSQLASKRWNVR